MTLNTYGHVFDELEGDERRPAEDVIRKARATSVRPRRARIAASTNENPV